MTATALASRDQSASPATIQYVRPWMYAKQRAAFFSDDTLAIVHADAKAGSTAAALVWIAEQAMQSKPGDTLWWIATGYGMARMAFERMRRAMPRHVGRPNVQALTITLANHATIAFKDADRPHLLVADNIRALVFDDAHRAKAESWAAIQETVRGTGARVRVIGKQEDAEPWFDALIEHAEQADIPVAELSLQDAIGAGLNPLPVGSVAIRSMDIAPHTSMLDVYPYSDLLVPARYKVFYGGRGAAKSWAFAEALIKRALNEPLLILCTRQYQSDIGDSVHRLLANTIKRLGLEWAFTVRKNGIKSRAGAEFIFKGLQDATKLKSAEAIDIVWVAEAENIENNSWTTLIPTIRKEGSEIWVEFNTSTEDAPTYVRFVTNTPKNAIVHKVNYTENPFFPEVLRLEMEHDKETDFHAYEHIWLGMPVHITDAMIFGGKYVVREFPDDLWEQADRLFFGADFGFANDPSTLIRFFIIGDTLYVEYEAYRVRVEVTEMPAFYDEVPLSREWPIKADSARPETISHIGGQGFVIHPAAKWEGCVKDGIQHIRGYKQIVIHPRCKYTAIEARLYSYKVDKKVIDPITKQPQVLPIVVDKHNHCWDAIRYGLDGHIQQGGSAGMWARLAE